MNPRGTDTTYLFTYGLTTRYGHRSATVDGGPGGAALPVSAVLHGLRPGRTYHYGLIGRRLAGARRALRRAHCRLGRVSHHHGSPGRVIAQDPSHGHRYGAGHRVSVTIGHS